MPWSGWLSCLSQFLPSKKRAMSSDLLPGAGRHRQVVADRGLERRLVGRIGQHVAAVIENLPVGVVQDPIALAIPAVERAQRGRHGVVAPARELPARHEGLHRQHRVLRDEVAIEVGGDHHPVETLRAAQQVEHHGGVELGDRHQRDVELAARELLPHRLEGEDRPRDRPVSALAVGQEMDGRAGVGRLAVAQHAAQLGLRGLDHRVLVRRAELQEHGAVVEPVHILPGRGGAAADQEEGQAGEPPCRSLHRSSSSPFGRCPLRGMENPGANYRRL